MDARASNHLSSRVLTRWNSIFLSLAIHWFGIYPWTQLFTQCRWIAVANLPRLLQVRDRVTRRITAKTFPALVISLVKWGSRIDSKLKFDSFTRLYKDQSGAMDRAMICSPWGFSQSQESMTSYTWCGDELLRLWVLFFFILGDFLTSPMQLTTLFLKNYAHANKWQEIPSSYSNYKMEKQTKFGLTSVLVPYLRFDLQA